MTTSLHDYDEEGSLSNKKLIALRLPQSGGKSSHESHKNILSVSPLTSHPKYLSPPYPPLPKYLSPPSPT